jgi:hypothetical protein
MYRLGELSASQRNRAGAAMLAGGTLLMAIAVILVHFAGFPEEEFIDGAFVPVVVEPAIFDAIPRGWFPKSVGYLLAFGASQLMIVGAAFLWVLNQKMTWARASFAAFLVWMEFVVIFGIVPSEWLNLSQTDLDWSPTRIFLTIPEWLILGNEIQISYAALKDMISGGYNLVALVLAGVVAYKLQDIGKPRPASAAKKEAVSPYGRPLVRKADD